MVNRGRVHCWFNHIKHNHDNSEQTLQSSRRKLAKPYPPWSCHVGWFAAKTFPLSGLSVYLLYSILTVTNWKTTVFRVYFLKYPRYFMVLEYLPTFPPNMTHLCRFQHHGLWAPFRVAMEFNDFPRKLNHLQPPLALTKRMVLWRRKKRRNHRRTSAYNKVDSGWLMCE